MRTKKGCSTSGAAKKGRNGFGAAKKGRNYYGITKARVLARLQEVEKGCTRLHPVPCCMYGDVDWTGLDGKQCVGILLLEMYQNWLGSANNATEFARRNSCIWEIAADVVSRLPMDVVEKIPYCSKQLPDVVRRAVVDGVVARGLSGRQDKTSFRGVKWRPMLPAASAERVQFREVCSGCGHEGTFVANTKPPTRGGDGLLVSWGRCSNCGISYTVVTHCYNMSFKEYEDMREKEIIKAYKDKIKDQIIKEYKAGLKSGKIN